MLLPFGGAEWGKYEGYPECFTYHTELMLWLLKVVMEFDAGLSAHVYAKTVAKQDAPGPG